MARRANWTLRTLGIAVASSLAGFWLPDGINLLTGLFGANFAVDFTARIASAIVLLSFSLVVEQAAMVHQMLADQREELSKAVAAQIQERLDAGVTELVTDAEVLGLGKSVGSTDIRSILSDVGALLRPFALMQEPLRSGVVAWMQGTPLEAYRKSANDLVSDGVTASLSQHVAVTRALFHASAKSYLQINQFAFDPETEWSREWIEFLTNANRSGRRMQYIVLNTEGYLIQAKTKLKSMQSYLRRCGAQLLTCDRQLVTDSLGPFDLAKNLELFDDSVIKTQTLSPTGYRGGITLTMSLAPAAERPDLLNVAKAVVQSAVPFRQ